MKKILKKPMESAGRIESLSAKPSIVPAFIADLSKKLNVQKN